jgi:hypothetical protein
MVNYYAIRSKSPPQPRSKSRGRVRESTQALPVANAKAPFLRRLNCCLEFGLGKTEKGVSSPKRAVHGRRLLVRTTLLCAIEAPSEDLKRLFRPALRTQ